METVVQNDKLGVPKTGFRLPASPLVTKSKEEEENVKFKDFYNNKFSKSGIYVIQNTANGKHYVGQSVNIRRRWLEHARAWTSPEADKKENKNQELHNDMRKFGADNFDFSVLKELPDSMDTNEVISYENEYIAKFDSVSNGYNKIYSNETGEGLVGTQNIVSHRHSISKETLESLLLTNTFQQVGKMFNVSDKAVVKWCKLYGMSTRAGDYMTDAKKTTHRKLMQEVANPPFIKKPLVAVDKKTGEVKGYASAADAARALGTSPANIQRAVNGKPRLTSLGRKWYTTDMFKGTLPEVFEEVPID